MDIDDIRRHKREAEYDLIKLISDWLSKFSETTGLNPQGLNIRFAEVDVAGCEHPDYIITDVRISVEI